MEKIISPTEPRKAWEGVPGFKSFDHPVTVREALDAIRGNFEVEKQPLMRMPERVMTSILSTGRVPSDITLSALARMVIKTHRATVNTRDDETLGVVGEDYGIVQNAKAFEFIDYLCNTDVNGGKPIINRNPDDYLTYAEICTLERLPNKTKTEAYEFLCISVPREVFIDGRVQRISKSYTLDTRAANQLRQILRNNFIRRYMDFVEKNEIFAKAKHIERSNVEILERFLMEYDIPVSHNQNEREGLRRLSYRWKQEAKRLVQDPTIIGNDLITRIDKHERYGGLPKYDDEK